MDGSSVTNIISSNTDSGDVSGLGLKVILSITSFYFYSHMFIEIMFNRVLLIVVKKFFTRTQFSQDLSNRL